MDLALDPSFSAENFARDLRAHLELCQSALDLALGENQALAGEAYQPFEFYQRRKDLLPRLEESLITLRGWRRQWQRLTPVERAGNDDVTALFQSVQQALMKVLLLDRENQQALLRRGLMPAGQLPAATVQQPHCVAERYRRHARG